MLNMQVAIALILAAYASAISLKLDDPSSVHSAAALVAKGAMDYYDGFHYGGVVGMFQPPYYWWEAGVAWNALIDFWHLTGDTQFNSEVQKSLLHQAGESHDFLPKNQTKSEGNDDQGLWGLTVMAAAEYDLPKLRDEDPDWLNIAQVVFNSIASRWELSDCGGGLRWQIYTWNAGYNYKNTVSNACLFNLAARLLRRTAIDTYNDWADYIYNWLETVGLLESLPDNSIKVWDGAGIEDQCGKLSTGEWSYNYGLMLAGCAVMYDVTRKSVWSDRAEKLWRRAKTMFQDNKIMYEATCQPHHNCNNDQRAFKAIFSQSLGYAARYLPSQRDEIMEYLNASAIAAARTCSGGKDKRTCGLDWTAAKWDGVFGLGEQLSALQVIQTTLTLSSSDALKIK